VLPILLSRLGAQDWQIGFARLVQTLGFTLPALLAAHRIHGRARHKSFMLTASGLGKVGILTLPPILMLYGENRPAFVIGWFLITYAVFWTMDGGCAVSWFDIMAKTIPARVRGRFFGVMQTLMGLLAIGAGYLVALILKNMPFPRNFAVLAGLWCVGSTISQIVLFFVREPEGQVDRHDPRPSFGEYAKRALPMLRANRRISRLILARLLLEGAGMAAPFYVLFAQRDLGISLKTAGIYVMIQSAGKIVLGPLWGGISDRLGPAMGMRVLSGAVVCMPLLAILAARGGPWLMAPVFFLMGGVQDGVWMIFSNVLLESASDHERPFAVGVASMSLTPTCLYGLAGGIIAQSTSYPIVFVCALVFALAGFLASLRIPPIHEPLGV